MRIIVIGAGAVGCFFGALLSQAGHEVVFVGRQPHVDAINTRGLLLETVQFKGHVPAKASADTSALKQAELILICVKSADTEKIGPSLVPMITPGTTILSLQNGVDNPQRLSGVINRPVVPAVVYVGAEMVGAGHVKHHGAGRLVIGPSTSSEALALAFSSANIPTEVSSEIEKVQWAKLISNCAWNALSAVSHTSYGAIVEVDGAKEVIASVVEECVTVARRSGVAVPDDMLSRVFAGGATMPGQLSSTAQDLSRNKPTEIDFLNGYIVRKGRELEIPTPVNRALQVMVKLCEKT